MQPQEGTHNWRENQSKSLFTLQLQHKQKSLDGPSVRLFVT